MASLPRERIVQIFRPLRFVSSLVAMATPLNRFANVAFRPPAQVSTGGNALPMLPKVPPASSSPMFVPSLREGESGVAKTEPTLPKRRRRPTISPRLACGPPEWKSSAAKTPEEICRQRRRFPKFRAHVSSLRTSGRLRRRNEQSDTADVARGPTGSP